AGVHSLADNAFATCAADLTKYFRTLADDVSAVTQGRILGQGIQQCFQACLTLQQGQLAQVLAVEEEQIESIVQQGTTGFQIMLQGGKSRAASRAGHHLTINERAAAGQSLQRWQQIFEAVS